MKTTEFNLLDEKWILVRKNDCTVTELSVTDVLLHAHEFKELAGELPTQDISILRLLLAILQTVFSRYTVSGERQDIADEDDAIDRWKELWDAGRFPEKPIREYLAQWYDRFWLFHPERPFYQTNAAQIGTPYEAKKLNGEISESNNKISLFSARAGDWKNTLTYPEAARWLLHVNNFDDSSGKASSEIRGKGAKSPGVGYLGKLGLIAAKGEDLFETLLLNLIPFNLFDEEIWPEESPIWELDQPRNEERCEIGPPKSLSELYTLQSRRIFLITEGEFVTKYKLLGGDFYGDDTDVYIEPMTIWHNVGKNKAQIEPKKFDSSIRMWREFASVFKKKEKSELPGVMHWVNYIDRQNLIDQRKQIVFQIISMTYGSKNSSVSDAFTQALTLHADLLTNLGERWRTTIAEEVDKYDETVSLLAILAKSVKKAAGMSPKAVDELFIAKKEKKDQQNACEQFYFSVDIPFREWLASIDPQWEIGSDEEYECLQHWHDAVKTIANRLADDLVKEVGDPAIVGRMIEEKNGSKKVKKYYSAPKALGFFKIGLNKLYPKEEHNA